MKLKPCPHSLEDPPNKWYEIQQLAPPEKKPYRIILVKKSGWWKPVSPQFRSYKYALRYLRKRKLKPTRYIP